MQNQSYMKLPVLYRPYSLPHHFPAFAFLGNNWNIVTKEPSFFHFHNCIEIGVCISGHGEVIIDYESYPFKAGDFCIIYPNIPHITTTTCDDCHWEFIFLDAFLFQKNLENSSECFPSLTDCFQCLYPLQNCPFVISKTDDCSALYTMLKNLYLEFHRKEFLYQDVIKGLLAAIIGELSLFHKQTSDSPLQTGQLEVIRNTLHYIHEHYNQNLTVPDLADKAFLSESHFRRIFKAIVGVSPQEYIEHYRIHQACSLIYRKAAPLNEIAGMIGFNSLSSFNRQFQKCMRMSPSKWYQANLSLPDPEVRSLSDPASQNFVPF